MAENLAGVTAPRRKPGGFVLGGVNVLSVSRLSLVWQSCCRTEWDNVGEGKGQAEYRLAWPPAGGVAVLRLTPLRTIAQMNRGVQGDEPTGEASLASVASVTGSPVNIRRQPDESFRTEAKSSDEKLRN